MNKIKYSLPVAALSLFLSGCGYDVEITSHNNTPDFSDYTGLVIDSQSVKGTYLDPEFRREKAMKFRDIMNQTSSKEFPLSKDALTKLDAYITELNQVEDIDVESLRMRLVAYKNDIIKLQQADKKRSDLTVDKILAKATPIFNEIDVLSSKKAAFDTYIKSEVEKQAALEKQQETLLGKIDEVNKATKKSIEKYIIDNELPIRKDYYSIYVHFSNEEEFREGNTCSPNRKDKPDFRGKLVTGSNGKKICTYKFYYSRSNHKDISEEHAKNIDAIADNGFKANHDNYVNLGLTEIQLDITEKSLNKKKIIAANKHGQSLRDIEYDLRSLNYRLEKLGDNLFNPDRTVNLESTAFKRAKRYNKEVPHMKVNRDMRIFTKFDSFNDDVYQQAAMKTIESIGHEVEMGSDGFDLPSGVEQQDIVFMIASSNDEPKEGDLTYLWDANAFAEPGMLQLDYKIRLFPSNKQQALKQILSASRT